MDTDKLIKLLKEGESDEFKIEPEKIEAYEIISITDIDVLKSLCEHIDSFKKLSLPETWAASEDRQSILGCMDYLNKYLNDLNEHKCYCVRYKYLEVDPLNENDDGLIEISELSKAIGGSVKYICKCNGCSKMLEVTHSLDGMGLDCYVWHRKN
ncbi:hypothetical protein KDW99_09045 [Marinomonas rhizomae]|uniref:hypothetical protein n=1 Tax=Marinomonas rhizomae TaxID=491948 RepID=UPI0021057045|nr:hypothetical protein [Marinomonas rhizomae]UTW01253.1 hypothetical protein KDW99_09045 [Marinomonas rhizomae]